MSRYDNYKKRLNRYGSSMQERLEKGRQENFAKFLARSPHTVFFNYNNEQQCGVLEPSSQDETETVMHLLTAVGQTYPIGEILHINESDYIIWYWDERQDSGYNRFTMIKLNMKISISNASRMKENPDGTPIWDVENIPCYLWGQQNNMLKNELKSRSRSATLYLENLKLEFIILPLRQDIQIGTYVQAKVQDQKGNFYYRYYRITGFDITSSPGLMYVSMDNIPERATGVPTDEEKESNPDTFWFTGNTELLDKDEEVGNE